MVSHNSGILVREDPQTTATEETDSWTQLAQCLMDTHILRGGWVARTPLPSQALRSPIVYPPPGNQQLL